MKSRILIGFIAVMLMACNEDQSISPVTDTRDNTEYFTSYESRNTVSLSVRVLLGGAVISGTESMRTDLLDVIPFEQPYGMSPFDYPGDERIANLPVDVVDWILVDLRDNATRDVLGRKAGLLMSDGTVLAPNGDAITFDVPRGNYLVAVHHRNHLSIISETTVDFEGGAGFIDFVHDWRDRPSAALDIGSGVAMLPGDANSNGTISFIGRANDKQALILRLRGKRNVVHGYFAEDLNLNGKVSYIGAANDKNVLIVDGLGGNTSGAITGGVTP